MTATHGATTHAFVTGAASGLGAAVCRQFAGRGTRVTAVDVRTYALDRFAATLRTAEGPRVTTLAGDLGNAGFSESVLPAAWSRWGPVDVAVLAAGIYPAMPFLEMTAEAWDRVQQVNVRSAMQIMRSLATLAIEHRRRASIVLISSGAAQRARRGAAAYCASKAALEMLTRAAALELGPSGIRVNAVSPGFIDVESPVNPVTRDYVAAMSTNPLGRPGTPDDIANAVAWLCSDEAAWVTGTVIRVDGGASAGAASLPLHWTGQTARQLPDGPARG
ncbi:MAG: SDR family NAD(P)-dependent oxidoreductase, partial [Streptosporangiaceae bacterium]